MKSWKIILFIISIITIFSCSSSNPTGNGVGGGDTTIIVITPNGGENWEIGSSYDLNWTATNINIFNIDYSIDNGTNWIEIAESISDTIYNWTIPNTPDSQCLVRIVSNNDSSISDISDSFFIISDTLTYSITVISPNGGENWETGSSYNINWIANNINIFNIDYSTDNGMSWIDIADSIFDTTYNWTIPNNPDSQCLVRISSNNDSSINDNSDAVFTILFGSFYEPFDSYSVGSTPSTAIWEIEINSPSNLEVVSNGYSDKGLKFVDSDGVSTAWIMTSILSNYTKISFYLYVENNNYDWGIRSVNDIVHYWSTMSWYLRFKNGEVSYLSDSTQFVTIENLNPETWYKFEITINWSNSTYDIYIDNTFKTTANFYSQTSSSNLIHLVDILNGEKIDGLIVDEIRVENNKGEKLYFSKPIIPANISQDIFKSSFNYIERIK